MAQAMQIEPDVAFIAEVMASGGSDLKKCVQCATCTAVCALSNDSTVFPRKQIVAAQWGLKDRVLADPAIWLCHNCGDCVLTCPRGAKPGNVMAALRKKAIEHFAFPRFAGRMVAKPGYLPILFLLPILIFASMAFAGLHRGITRPYVYAELFPATVLEPLFFAVSGLAVLAFAVGLRRYVVALRSGGAEVPILSGLSPALVEIAAHQRFTKCTANRARYWGHLLTSFGFVGLAVMGTSVGVGTMTGVMHTPLPLLSGWKLFANLSAAVILAGIVLLLAERIRSPETSADTGYFDWFFLLTLAGVAATGILSELLRVAQWAELMYPVYFIHLVLIFSLFLYAPYSKFAHLVYRTAAMAATNGTGTSHEQQPGA